MIWLKVAGFFGSGIGKISLIIALCSSLFVARQIDKANLRNQGATRAVEKIEKSNEKAADLGKKAAAKSRAPAAGRVQHPADPTTRD